MSPDGGRSAAGPVADAADVRAARRSRAAGGAVVLVLLAVSAFAVWTSEATAAAAADAVAANVLSDDYAAGAAAVAAEESLERKYRLEPGVDVRVRFADAAGRLTVALGDVRRDGDDGDRALVDRVLARHRDFVVATGRLFDAVDRRDEAAVLRIDETETEPAFAEIESAVRQATGAEHDHALAELADLQDLERTTRRLTPLVFLAGLLLAALLAAVTRGHRRLLLIEKARAVHDARHDALTGLPNRVELAHRLAATLRGGTRNGLLLIDLDRFKEINDTVGHHHGDELLTRVGERLRGAVRPADTVARLGGDEFAVLLPDLTSVDAAVEVAGTLREALTAPFPIAGIDYDVEASIGIVLSGEHGDDPSTLLQRADVAMYVSKRRGVGPFVYDPAADEHRPEKLAVLGDLRRALDGTELVLHYQPKIGIDGGDVVGAEALVRWQHPQRGLMAPAEFMPLAEHTGLIGPLTRYVLDTALARARTWLDRGRPLAVSVNLSARNLADERLPDHVAELLTRHGVPAGLLVLEVTESAIMTEPLRAQQLLARLSVQGVGISVDDFGAGYTSLGQLKTLPIDELKIDRSFVTSMTEFGSNALIVQSIVDLAHNLGLTVVAEGIEDEPTLRGLAAFGCDVGQGYHLSAPLPADAFYAWWSRREPAPDVGGREGAGSRSTPEVVRQP